MPLRSYSVYQGFKLNHGKSNKMITLKFFLSLLSTFEAKSIFWAEGTVSKISFKWISVKWNHRIKLSLTKSTHFIYKINPERFFCNLVLFLFVHNRIGKLSGIRPSTRSWLSFAESTNTEQTFRKNSTMDIWW